jgi:hypothetical protein
MHEVLRDRIAVLTTRVEKGWYIFGYLYIMKVSEDGGSTWVQGDKNRSLALSRDQWLPFWDFDPLGTTTQWTYGLYRYLSDKAVFRILKGIYYSLRSPRDREITERHLNTYAMRTGLKWPSKASKKTMSLTRKIGILRKYGPGGESAKHKRLKQYVYDNPSSLGIEGVRARFMEYSFLTGDRADVVFELNNGKWVTIEIELEGRQNTYCGLLQAIKYRALMEVEQRKKVGKQITTFLVAHSIPHSVKSLANAYGVSQFETKPTLSRHRK